MNLFGLANAIMSLRAGNFLGTTGDTDIGGQVADWVAPLKTAIQGVLAPILIIVGAAGAIYAVVLGVNMARAESTDKREEAKKRLVGVLIGVVSMIALVIFFLVFFPSIIDSFVTPNITE